MIRHKCSYTVIFARPLSLESYATNRFVSTALAHEFAYGYRTRTQTCEPVSPYQSPTSRADLDAFRSVCASRLPLTSLIDRRVAERLFLDIPLVYSLLAQISARTEMLLRVRLRLRWAQQSYGLRHIVHHLD
jgi:hypothetical protein